MRTTTCGFVSTKQVQFAAASGQTAFDKFARSASVCRGEEAEISPFEEVEVTELNGVEDGEDRVSSPDWRVRAGSRNR